MTSTGCSDINCQIIIAHCLVPPCYFSITVHFLWLYYIHAFYVKKGRYLRKIASLFALYFIFRVLFCTLYNFQLLFLLKMYIFISNVILHNQILYLPEKFLCRSSCSFPFNKVSYKERIIGFSFDFLI